MGGGAAQLQPTQLRCHNTVIGALKDGPGGILKMSHDIKMAARK